MRTKILSLIVNTLKGYEKRALDYLEKLDLKKAAKIAGYTTLGALTIPAAIYLSGCGKKSNPITGQPQAQYTKISATVLEKQPAAKGLKYLAAPKAGADVYFSMDDVIDSTDYKGTTNDQGKAEVKVPADKGKGQVIVDINQDSIPDSIVPDIDPSQGITVTQDTKNLNLGEIISSQNKLKKSHLKIKLKRYQGNVNIPPDVLSPDPSELVDAYKIGKNFYIEISGKLSKDDYTELPNYSLRIYDKTTGAEVYNVSLADLQAPAEGEKDINLKLSLDAITNAQDLQELVAELYDDQGNIYASETFKAFKPFIKFIEENLPTGKYREGEQPSAKSKLWNCDMDEIQYGLTLEDDQGNILYDQTTVNPAKLAEDMYGDLEGKIRGLTIADIAKAVRGKLKVCTKINGKSAQHAKKCKWFQTGGDLDVYTKIAVARNNPVEIGLVDEDGLNYKTLSANMQPYDFSWHVDGSKLYVALGQKGGLITMDSTSGATSQILSDDIRGVVVCKNGDVYYTKMVGGFESLYKLGQPAELFGSAGITDLNCSDDSNKLYFIYQADVGELPGVWSYDLTNKSLVKIVGPPPADLIRVGGLSLFNNELVYPDDQQKNLYKFNLLTNQETFFSGPFSSIVAHPEHKRDGKILVSIGSDLIEIDSGNNFITSSTKAKALK